LCRFPWCWSPTLRRYWRPFWWWSPALGRAVRWLVRHGKPPLSRDVPYRWERRGLANITRRSTSQNIYRWPTSPDAVSMLFCLVWLLIRQQCKSSASRAAEFIVSCSVASAVLALAMDDSAPPIADATPSNVVIANGKLPFWKFRRAVSNSPVAVPRSDSAVSISVTPFLAYCEIVRSISGNARANSAQPSSTVVVDAFAVVVLVPVA